MFRTNSHVAGKASVLQGPLWRGQGRRQEPSTPGKLVPKVPTSPTHHLHEAASRIFTPSQHSLFPDKKVPTANTNAVCPGNSPLGADHTVSRPQSYKEAAANLRLSRTILINVHPWQAGTVPVYLYLARGQA